MNRFRKGIVGWVVVASAMGTAQACVGSEPDGNEADGGVGPERPDATTSSSSSSGATSSSGSSGASSSGEHDASVPVDAAEACDGGLVCAGVCVDPNSDANHCGGCDTKCTSAAGTAFACVQGTCGNKVVQVEAGFKNSCVVLLDSTVWCWGERSQGAVVTVDASPTPTPTKIALDNVAEVSVGYSFACARKHDGSVWCWGDNTKGVLGRVPGSEPACTGKCSPMPVQVVLPGGLKAAQLTTSLGTVCVRTDGASGGDVYCWGDSFGGILGNAALPVGSIEPAPTKIPVFNGDVLSVSLSNHDDGGPGDRPFACALRSDHSVWCWGVNYMGGLGHAPSGVDASCTSTATMACNGNPIKVAGLPTMKSISTGGAFACATTDAGAMWCWGANNDGELGVDSLLSTSTPAQVSGLNTIVGVATGDLSTLALDSTGHVSSWGANGHGQLALGAYSGEPCDFTCMKKANSAPLLQGSKQISLRYLSGIALKNDGSVFTWGNNANAQLGHAANTNGDTKCNYGNGFCNPTPAALASPPWAN